MIKLKINKNSYELVASSDIPRGTVVFSCTWFNQSSKNSFPLPKTNLSVEDVLKLEDMFAYVALSGFGEYIIPDKNSNTHPIIDFDSKEIKFISNKLIKEGDLITYSFSPETFPHVKIQ